MNELVEIFEAQPRLIEDAIAADHVGLEWLAREIPMLSTSIGSTSPTITQCIRDSTLPAIPTRRWAALVDDATDVSELQTVGISEWVTLLPNSAGSVGLLLPDNASLQRNQLEFFLEFGGEPEIVSFVFETPGIASPEANYPMLLNLSRGAELTLRRIGVEGPSHCKTLDCIPIDPSSCKCQKYTAVTSQGLQKLGCKCRSHNCR